MDLAASPPPEPRADDPRRDGLAPRPSPLPSALAALADCLREIRDGSFSHLPDRIGSWQDPDYFYLEVELPGLPTLVGDACFQGGRIFIRVAR